MSREIKFRAWVKHRNCFIGSDYPKNWDDDIGCEEWYDNEESMMITSIEMFLENDDYILEQYTGLKDKNGKEIYEGDIVLTDELNWVGKCIYHYDGFMLVDNIGGFSSPTWKDCMVMGNIHETPELLK